MNAVALASIEVSARRVNPMQAFSFAKELSYRLRDRIVSSNVPVAIAPVDPLRPE